jgi:hypothetical protein
MGLHSEPAWVHKVARAIGGPDHASPEPISETRDDMAPRRYSVWPIAAIVLGLLATLVWALALAWAVLRALWGVIAFVP